ncbi:hypothetical protein B0H14DRAFT_3126829 [Mycena olivaceomarginata]|nr:hypothetical protein B0H14DRAFT_3126829 [Mycena olivaceomarginata]
MFAVGREVGSQSPPGTSGDLHHLRRRPQLPSARALRRLMRRPRLPGLPSTQEHPTRRLLHWGPDARRHRHAQPSMPSASKPQRSYRRPPATSLRGAATRTSAVRHLPPPFFRLISLRLAGAWRRHPPRLPAAPAVAGDPLQHRHTARDIPRTARLRHRLISAIAPPTPYDADTLDTTPARTPVPTHIARRTGSAVPPSPLDPRACALQYHLQHVPRPRHALRSFFIAGVAFVAFSYATTIYCPHCSTHAAGRIHNTTPTSPAPAAATLHRAPRVRRLPARLGHPQRRPTPPLKTCPWRAPPAAVPHTPATFVPSPPQHHLRAQHPSQAFPTVRAASLGPTAQHTRLLDAARRQRQHPPAALHALTASILSATTRLRRVSRRTETAAVTLCAGIKIPLYSLSERAAALAAFRGRRPTVSARGREGGRVTYCVLSPIEKDQKMN